MTKRILFLAVFTFFFVISLNTFAQEKEKKSPKEQTEEALKTSTEIFPGLKDKPTDEALEEKDQKQLDEDQKKDDKFKEETLVDESFESGGYGALDVKFTKIAGDFGILVGGRGGWIVNHKFIIGAGGWGLINNISTNASNNQFYNIDMGYGGLLIEYIIHSEKLIHLSASLLTGAGQIGFQETNTFGTDHFFVLEPEACLIINVAKYFRVATTIGFRITQSAKLDQIQNNDLIFVNGGIMLKFGKF